MKKWSVTDINVVERFPTSPAQLHAKVSEIMYNSTNCRCKVETVNPTTGEYRIVLYGTLDCAGDEGFPRGN